MTSTARDFLSLAEREASRYGGESLVFLRELLQNARDAGAHEVIIQIENTDGIESISIVDNGRGMVLDHAQRFLFTLYASSKRHSAGSAGRFGVGFWSILRFEPTEITIRSRAAGLTEGWEIVFDSALNILSHRRCSMKSGTTVVMKRATRSLDLEGAAWDLIRRDAKYLRCRDKPEAQLEVRVNGRLATEAMVPNLPGLSFRRSGLRGVISLGSVPSVTLLAHGLRVRSAAFVDDLILRPSRRPKNTGNPPVSGLSPQVVIDSDRLAVLMDRGDVAQDRALDSIARVIRSETRRLCEIELDRLAPRSIWKTAWDSAVRHRKAALFGTLVIAALALLTVGKGWLPRHSISSTNQAVDAGRWGGVNPYVDRSESYAGPVTESIEGAGGAPILQYRPENLRPFIAAFRINGIDEAGLPIRSKQALRPAQASEANHDDDIEIEVEFRDSGSILRLPVPTGYLIDQRSLLIDGQKAELWITPDDEPAIQLTKEGTGRISYRAMRTASHDHSEQQWPALPASVSSLAGRLREFPPQRRIEESIRLVQSSLERTDNDYGSPDRYLTRVLQAGGGDCDVVNTLLASVLTEAGMKSRLAVGWVGDGGAPLPGLHAWVEVDLGGGRWVPADASVARLSEETGRLIGTEANVEIADAPAAKKSWRGSLPGVWAWPVVLAAILSISMTVLVRRYWVRREFTEGGSLDSGPLVESLVRDREAWPGYAGARRRPLVPSLGSGNYSLAEIEKAGSRSKVFVAESRNQWVLDVEEAGCLVIDGSTRAGRVVAASCGAFDLESWENLWARAQGGGFCGQVQEALRCSGFDIDVRIAADVPGGSVSLVVDEGDRAWVVIGEDRSDWKKIERSFPTGGHQAIFYAADLVVETLSVLVPQAESALSELAHSVLKNCSSGGEGMS